MSLATFRINFLLKKAGKQKDLHKAIVIYEKILKINPKLPAIHNYIGLCHFELQSYQKAEKHFLKSLELKDEAFQSYHEVLGNLALTYHIENHFDKAKQYYQQVMAEFPDYMVPVKNYGYLLFNQKKYPEALEIFNHYLKKHQDSETYNNIGVIYEELDKQQKAIIAYEKSIELDPEYALSYNNLGVIYSEQKTYEKATKYFQKAIKKDPHFLNAYNNLASIHLIHQQYNTALALYNKAYEIFPGNRYILLNIAVTYHHIQDEKNTLFYLKKAVSAGLDKDLILTHDLLSTIHNLDKKLAE